MCAECQPALFRRREENQPSDGGGTHLSQPLDLGNLVCKRLRVVVELSEQLFALLPGRVTLGKDGIALCDKLLALGRPVVGRWRAVAGEGIVALSQELFALGK